MSDTRVSARPYMIGSAETYFATPAGATLQLDLDASIAGSITTSGSLVSQWVDQSANGYVFTQATGANQPIYPGATQNGLNTMEFGNAGAVTFLDGSPIISQRMLVFGVYASSVLTGGQNIFDNQTGNDTTRFLFTAKTNAGHVAAAFAGLQVLGTTDLTTLWHVVCLDFNFASSAVYVNGTQEATGSVGTNPGMTTMRLGANFAGLGTALVGNLAELKIYTGVVDADIATITTQLRNKWGI